MILVTGANGFVGSYLVKELLKQGEQVRGLKRATSQIHLLGDAADKVEWFEGDVTDVHSLQPAMKGVKKVYHAAAIISFLPKDFDTMMKVNVEGTANVVNEALLAGVEKLVLVSSVAAFGLPKQGKMIDESTEYQEQKDMITYYRSKFLGELEAWRGEAEGLNVVVACPSTILGAGNFDSEPNLVFAEVAKGAPFYTEGKMGFVDVRDVVRALILLMNSDAKGEKFIISGENSSFKNLMFHAAEVMKVQKPKIKVSPGLVALAWRYEWLKHKLTGKRPVVSKESARIATTNFEFNNAKLRERFNFTYTPLGTTIKETCLAYQKCKAAGKVWEVFENVKN
jgi:nucleoside-diphosphate-sugar epimerase